MPAYIYGLIMLEKDIKKGQSIRVLGGTTEALYHTMTQNGIQHSAKENAIMASDLVILISLTFNRFSLSSAWAVEAMFRL